MKKKRTIPKRSPKLKRRPATSATSQYLKSLDHALVLVDTICSLAGADSLSGPNSRRLQQAILGHDTSYLFKHLVESFSLQGISDHAAWTYMESHDRLTWQDLQRATSRLPACSKLRGYWTFCGCRYQKTARTCAEPATLLKCSVPRSALRNGRLNQMTYSLFLFIRDVADNNLVNWIDRSLADANIGRGQKRLHRMQRSLIDPLRNIYGISNKLLNMALADTLMAAPASKPLWRETGASLIAIDTLVHNFPLPSGHFLAAWD